MKPVIPDRKLKFISSPKPYIMDIVRSTSMDFPEMMLYDGNIPRRWN